MMRVPPPPLSVRESLALIEIAGNGVMGFVEGADIAVRQHGFRDLADFWSCATSEPVTGRRFVSLLSAFQHDPAESPFSFNLRVVRPLEESLMGAMEEQVDWMIVKTFAPKGEKSFYDYVKVRPREAAEWLLSRPKRAYLVPTSLQDFLGDANHVTIEGELTPPVLPEPNEIPQAAPRRPLGRSFSRADTLLVERMKALVSSGEEPSPTRAAWSVIGIDGSGAQGSGTPESKVRRLVSRYRSEHGE